MNRPMNDADKKLVGEITKKFNQSRDSKRTMNNLKRLWLALYLDQQFSWINKMGEFNTLTDSEIERLREAKRIYPLFLNLLKPTIMLIVSQLTQRQPVCKFQPKGVGQAVYYAANATNDILEAFRQAQDYLRDDLANANWMTITGDSFKWTHPREASDEFIEVPALEDDGKTQKLDADGNPLMERIPAKFEVTTETLPWTSVFPPPGERKIPEMPWLIVKRDLDKTYLQDRYGVDLPTKSTNRDDSYDVGDHTHTHSYEQFGQQIAVLDYLEKPTGANPRGRHVVIALDEELVLDQGEFPYWTKVPVYRTDETGQESAVPGEFEEKWGGYRIQHFLYWDSLINFWGQGLPSPVADIQKRINHILTAWATNLICTMGVKLPYYDSMELPADFLDNEPKSVKVPTGQILPQYMNPPQLNPQVLNLVQFLITVMDQITGINRLAKGGEPEQRMPNSALQTTITTDLAKLRPILDHYSDTECRVAWDIYHSIRQFCPDYAKQVLGPDRVAEYQAFVNDDPEDYELKVERESNIPESKEGNIETIERMIKATQGQMMNGFQSPDDFVNLLRAMDTSMSRAWSKNYTQSGELIGQENRMMLNGTKPTVDLLHNHAEHIKGHQKPYNSPEYYTKILGKPADDIFKQHEMEHANMEKYGTATPTDQQVQQAAAVQQMQAQAAMLAGAKGGAAGDGQPPAEAIQ